MIQVTPEIALDESEIQLNFTRSSGPGGQNVNKVATSVQLRFNIDASPTLSDEVKQRLHRIARNRIAADGTLVIEARRHRTQEQNREEAIARLTSLIYQATQKPKPRKQTRPTAASQAKRLEAKQRRGLVKRQRRFPFGEE